MPEEFTLEDFAPAREDEFTLADFEEPKVTREQALRTAVTVPLEMTGRLQSALGAGLDVARGIQEERALAVPPPPATGEERAMRDVALLTPELQQEFARREAEFPGVIRPPTTGEQILSAIGSTRGVITPRTIEQEAEARTRPTTYGEAVTRNVRRLGESVLTPEGAAVIAGSVVVPELVLPAITAVGVKGLMESVPELVRPDLTGPERLERGLDVAETAAMTAAPILGRVLPRWPERFPDLETMKRARVVPPGEIAAGEPPPVPPEPPATRLPLPPPARPGPVVPRPSPPIVPPPPVAPPAAPATPGSLAIEAQKAAGWDPDWPFVPADFQNPTFREGIENDPSLSPAEKDRMFAAAEKLLGGKIERVAAPAPPVTPPAPQTVTLYHGEGGEGGAGTDTGFFTRDPKRAASYGPNVTSVEVPLDVAEAAAKERASRGLGTEGDYILPPEWSGKATPMEKPPAPTVHEVKVSLTPDQLEPALLVNGVPVTGGKNHKEIFDNQEDKTVELFEALADDSKHVFIDMDGNVYSRREAADALGEKAPLQSERLSELQASKPAEAPPAAPTPITKTVTHYSDDPNRQFEPGRHAYFHPTEAFDGSNLEPGKGRVFVGEVTLKNPKVLSVEESSELTAEKIADLKKQGFDGVVSDDGSEVIAFDPKQQFKQIWNFVPGSATPPAAPAPPAAPPPAPPELPPAAPEVAASEEATESEAAPSGSVMQAVRVFADAIGKGELTKQGAIEFLDAWYGGTMAEGKYTAKDLTDIIEMAINQWIRDSKISPSDTEASKARTDILALKLMLSRTPTQTTRTAEMDKMQQFSTPPPHAYVVAWVANLKPSDVVLEPSAGPGGIAVFPKNAGATVLGNELSPRRAELLRQSGIADQVTTHNAELIHAYLAPAIASGQTPRPTVVLMNPPFSNAAMTTKKNTMVGAKHVESALKTLPPGGRLVAIVGEGMAFDKPAFQSWWTAIGKKYNVRANIGISGKEYAKYGTHFGNQIIVIDNTGPTMSWANMVTGNVEKVEDLIPLLERIKNDRPAIKQAPAQPSGPAAPRTPSPAPTPTGPGITPAGTSGARPPRPAGGAPGPARPPVQVPSGLGVVPTPPTVGPRGTGAPPVPTGGVTGTPPAPVPSGGGVPPTSGIGEAGLTLEEKEAGEHELIEHGVFSEYKPRKVKIKGAQPHTTPLVETTAMASVEPVDPSYVPSIPQELISSGALSDAQLEQIVYGGQAHQVILPNGYRMGYFNGDGTGVGKGRTGGGFMLDNWNKGRKKHVWLSVKKELVKDATRDLTALGFKADQIIDMNKNGGKNVIGKTEGIAFVTYSGMARSNPGLEPIDPHAPAGTPRKLRGVSAPQKPPEGQDWPIGTKVARFPIFTEGAGLANLSERELALKAGGPIYTVVSKPKLTKDGFTYTVKSPEGKKEKAIAKANWAVIEKPTAKVTEAPAEPEKTRIQLLYEWLGPDFDGIILFDEAHKAGNAIDIKGSRGVQEASQTGMMVLDVQALFPRARVVYSSATGASNITNLSYADRLGIWGEGTPWPDKGAFFSDIQAGGLSAMEIVARDLKSMGRYLARTLSFEGVEKDQITHELTPDQIAIYNELSEAWQVVFQARNSTMAHTGAANNGYARGKQNQVFYGAQQRFYNQLLTALQMPTLIKEMRASLAKGNSVVISLVNTNEATLDREIAEKGGGKGEVDENWMDDIDLSPKKILQHWIEKSYPTQLYEEETDDNGNVRWVPVFQQLPDGSKVPVQDPEAIAKKQELIDRIGLLKSPENPLEMILNEFGRDNVAELTGRKHRPVLIKQPDGTFQPGLEPRNDAKLAREQKDFEDGKRRILVHTGKAGTGFTFSASRAFKNQQRRDWYGVQMGWRSDEALQAMGRVHRNDQAHAPFYHLMSTNLKGHQRFMSTMARRLQEMGALTGGERKGAGGDLFDETNNLENEYAEDAVLALFKDLHAGNVEGMSFDDITRQLGYTMTILNPRTGEEEIVNTLTSRDGGLNETKIPTIQQFLNRILALKFHDQNNLFEEFIERMRLRIERAKEDGSYDPGTQVLRGQNIRKLEDKVVYEHPSSTAKTRLVEIQYDEPVKITSFADLGKGKPVVKFVTNIRSGKLYALKEGPNRTLESGTIVQTYRRISPGSSDLMARQAIDDFLQGDDAKFRKENFLTLGDAENAWNAELAKTPKIRTLRDTYVVGAFLPIWDRLQIPDPKIWRITTAAKETFLGALIPPGMVRDVRARLGAGSGEATSPEATFNDILVRNTKITLANGWELRRSRVQGEPRIEVVGMSYDEGRQFVTKMGGFMERIAYQPRHFIPTDPDVGIPVLARVLQQSPPVGPSTGGGISVGPGGASPGDVPPTPPPAAGVASQPAWQRANGVVTPSTPGLGHMVRNFGNFLVATVRQLAGQWPVKTTMADRETGEAMARYAASRSAALKLAKVFSAQSLQGTGVDPVKFGEALVEDNLRSIREGFRQQATQLLADGRPQEALEASKKADAVVSLVGNQGSHFPTEDDYQDFLAQGPTRQAIRQHIQQWEEVIDPQFKLAMRLDPDEPLPSRGLQTGARVNLKAIFPGETGVNVVGRAGPSLTGTFRRKSPFGRQAFGTGQAYEVNYHELIANTFQRQLEIANKNEMDRLLKDSGNAKIAPPGQAIEVAGERGIAFPLTRQTIVLPGRGAVTRARNLYVRESLAEEYRTAANIDASRAIQVVSKVMGVFNKAALAGLTDFTVHMSNQFTALLVRPVSGNILIDTLLSATGRVDVPVVLLKALLKAFQNNDAQLAELAELGALRDPHAGMNPLGRILVKTDEVTRLLLDDAFQRLAESGLVPKTETARREYANAIGQYNKRMMGPLTRWLRETGFGPFIVAGKTFPILGIKTVTLSPGTKATNVFAAAVLRANLLAKWIGFAVLLATLHYLLTRDKGGGLLGRKGVPLGNLDTGLTSKTGKPLSIPLMDIMGLGRGLRATGIKGYVQAKYLGMTDGNALDAALRDVINSAVGPIAGPGIRAAFITATGSQPAVNVPRTAPYAPPGKSQAAVNVVAALKEANPLVRTALDLQEGKTVGEAAGRQFPRFAMRPGMEGERAEKMPQIVNAAQLRSYTEGVAKKARDLPLDQRWKFVSKKFAEDKLSVENRSRAVIQLERQGVFKYR